MTDKTNEHQRLILDQFTKQAVPFSQMQHHSPELLLAVSKVGPEDHVLDVACGPGLMAFAFARVARHVTGIDLTPAMIEQARVLQQSHGLTNLTWHIGDVLPLPFPGAAFSLVFTRYSFHHFLDSRAVLAEMVRVCSPGGRVVVVDVYTSNPQEAGRLCIRDPSTRMQNRRCGRDNYDRERCNSGLVFTQPPATNKGHYFWPSLVRKCVCGGSALHSIFSVEDLGAVEHSRKHCRYVGMRQTEKKAVTSVKSGGKVNPAINYP